MGKGFWKPKNIYIYIGDIENKVITLYNSFKEITKDNN